MIAHIFKLYLENIVPLESEVCPFLWGEWSIEWEIDAWST